jgi:hypothetical protein
MPKELPFLSPNQPARFALKHPSIWGHNLGHLQDEEPSHLAFDIPPDLLAITSDNFKPQSPFINL